jgi:hypothetical protein
VVRHRSGGRVLEAAPAGQQHQGKDEFGGGEHQPEDRLVGLEDGRHYDHDEHGDHQRVQRRAPGPEQEAETHQDAPADELSHVRARVLGTAMGEEEPGDQIHGGEDGEDPAHRPGRLGQRPSLRAMHQQGEADPESVARDMEKVSAGGTPLIGGLEECSQDLLAPHIPIALRVQAQPASVTEVGIVHA